MSKSTEALTKEDAADTKIKQDILKELTIEFNKTIKEFFNKDVQTSLEALVDARFADFINQSSQNVSVLDQSFSAKVGLEDRITQLELSTGRKMEIMNKEIEDFKREIEQKNRQIFDLTNENKKLRNENECLTHGNLNLHERDANIEMPAVVNQRLSILEKKVDNCSVELDGVQQYTRLGTLEFGNIPKGGNLQNPEDCYEVIKEFCDQYLNITVMRYDISIAHRQYNPAEKRKYGKDYIPSIYVKFVNRFLAQFVLERKNWLKKYRNRFGGKFFVRENLTLNRRILWDLVESKLHSYKFKWIKNGKIFVKKYAKSRPIHVQSELVLDQLITNLSRPIVPAPVLKMPAVPNDKAEHKPEKAHPGLMQTQAAGYKLPLPCLPPQNQTFRSQSVPMQSHASNTSQSISLSSQIQVNPTQNNPVLHDTVFEPSTSSRTRQNHLPYYTPYEETNFRYRNSLLSPASLSDYQSVYSSFRQPYGNRKNSNGGFYPC